MKSSCDASCCTSSRKGSCAFATSASWPTAEGRLSCPSASIGSVPHNQRRPNPTAPQLRRTDGHHPKIYSSRNPTPLPSGTLRCGMNRLTPTQISGVSQHAPCRCVPATLRPSWHSTSPSVFQLVLRCREVLPSKSVVSCSTVRGCKLSTAHPSIIQSP